jgi:hypothetical protein
MLQSDWYAVPAAGNTGEEQAQSAQISRTPKGEFSGRPTPLHANGVASIAQHPEMGCMPGRVCTSTFSIECRVQAKITTSENQIKELQDKADAFERSNENLVARVRELELAAHVAAQNAAAAGVRVTPQPHAAPAEFVVQDPSHGISLVAGGSRLCIGLVLWLECVYLLMMTRTLYQTTISPCNDEPP